MNTIGRPMFKVDGIVNVEDVPSLRDIGVSILGISVADAANLERLRHIVSDDYTDVCYRFDLRKITDDECVKVCEMQQPLAVDFVGHFLPTKEVCEALLAKGINVFFSNIEASYDTDPSWILSRHHKLLALKNTNYQIDLLEQTEDAWRILRDVVSEDRDELTVADIDLITKKQCVFLNLNFTPSNVTEIWKRIPNARGISFSLEQSSFRRWYTTQMIKEVVNRLT